jgi:D-glycero-D-manno-heptose 1,7-bisphosphate phosphatase
MLEKMMHLYQVDPDKSWMIGDQERDVEAGKKAGVKTLHIESNSDLNKYLPLS